MDAALTLTRMLESSARLQILVTSRTVLHLSGEHEYPVPPLPLPDPGHTSPEAVSRSPSVQLFVQRASAVVPDFVLTREYAVPVARICARVDGLPLAIELAAARIKMFTPLAIRARLEQGLDFLSRGPADVPVRQQTLRKTIDWSYELLSSAEQKLFQRLSVFRGGWTLEGAEAVCNTRRDLGSDVVDLLSSLVDKSLVQQAGDGDEVRFSMLETLREYALGRLVESGEVAPTRKAHAAYCLVVAEEGNALLTDLDREVWLASCDTEHDNMRAALDWLVEENEANWGLRLAGALFTFWERREHLVEGRARCEALLKLPGAAGRTRPRANILKFAAAFATTMGDFESADRLNDEAFEIYRELGDRKGIVAQLNTRGVQACLAGNWLVARPAFEESLAGCRELGDLRATASVLSNLADVVSAQGDQALARTLLEEAREKFCQVEDWRGVGWSLNHLGDVAHESGDLAGARRLYEEGANLFRDRGDPWGTARSLADLGDLAREQNELAAASGLLKDALGIFTGLRHRRGIASVLDGFAGLAARAGDAERALTLAGAAAALRQTLGNPRRPRDRGRVDETVDELRREQDCESVRAYSAAGATMTLEDVIRYALEERIAPTTAGSTEPATDPKLSQA
jgi:predicted ATPase